MNNDKKMSELIELKKLNLMTMKDLLYTNDYSQLKKAMDNHNYIQSEIFSIAPLCLKIPEKKSINFETIETVEPTNSFVKYVSQGQQEPLFQQEITHREALFKSQVDALFPSIVNGSKFNVQSALPVISIKSEDLPRQSIFSLFVPEQNDSSLVTPTWYPTPLVPNAADTIAMPYTGVQQSTVALEDIKPVKICKNDLLFGDTSPLLPAYSIQEGPVSVDTKLDVVTTNPESYLDIYEEY